MSITLVTVRDNARNLLRDTDSENYTHSDDSLNLLINQELRAMHNYLKNADESYQLTKFEYTAQTDAVTDTDYERYTLPTAFGSIVGLIWVGDNARDTIVPFQDSVVGSRADRTGKPIWYYFKGNEFGLIPRPSSTKKIELWYIPKYVDLSADSDLLTIPDDYVNIPMLYVTFMALRLKGEHQISSMIERTYKTEKKEFRRYGARQGFIVKTRSGFGTGYGTNQAILR